MFKRILFIFLLLFVPRVSALEQVPDSLIKGRIVEVEKSVIVEGNTHQLLKIKLSNNEVISVENNPNLSTRNIEYKEGDLVVLQKFINSGSSLNTRDILDSEQIYLITDYYRVPYLLIVFIVFSFLTFFIGRKYGLYSIFGMAFSFLIIFKFILPQIISGKNPVTITILASMLIIPVSFYLSHGFNKKTHVAIVSTVIALIFTVIFTSISVQLAKLTGYATEEAFFLKERFGDINMRGILLAGIIIGFLGVLDDITVSQSSVVMQLKKTDANLGTLDLYKKAMEVGRDHITSMVNTLVLVYAGASLPLLLLFVNNPEPLFFTLNREIIADEILRTLLGSIGLILAVPVSTFLAAIVADSDTLV